MFQKIGFFYIMPTKLRRSNGIKCRFCFSWKKSTLRKNNNIKTNIELASWSIKNGVRDEYDFFFLPLVSLEAKAAAISATRERGFDLNDF